MENQILIFRGLGEGIKNRVQQYHRTRDFENTPE